VAAADLTGNEERYVLDAVRSSWISSTGAYVERFEREFADACSTRTAIGVANGTLALHLALLTLDLRPGDEVIVPSLTYIATANAVRYCGAEPVFVDVDPQTWCLDPRKLPAAITGRTKGIIPVHLYGHPADMDPINQFAAASGLWVVEDAAEAHFATYKGRRAGSLARIGTFSFYGNKVLTSGEGGAVTLDDPVLEERARLLRGQGVDPQRRYFFPVVGYNYRLTNVACALLCAQLERAHSILEARHRIFRRYRQALQGVEGIGFQEPAPWAGATPWLFCVTVDPNAFGRTRDELQLRLTGEGVETRPFFVPVHTLPPYRQGSSNRGEVLPVTDALGSAGLNLPTFNTMTDAQIDFVAGLIRDLAR
jgi:perosamine synthetase